jgi:protein gp37
MGERTAIGWTDASWNPWHGCTKVSPGCAHCYMFRDKTRYGQNPELVVRSKTKFSEPLKWKEPKMVFTCSWSDWFHEAADAWRDEAWDIIRRTPHLTYQILTKRPERIADHLPADWGEGWPHVWLGVSIENNRWRQRAWDLIAVKAAVHFISCEPLLGPVDFENDALADIDWLIAGGESGPDCRPMREDWARSLRDQCAEYDVAFFLKQLGGHPDARAHEKAVLDDRTYTAFPRALTTVEKA